MGCSGRRMPTDVKIMAFSTIAAYWSITTVMLSKRVDGDDSLFA